MPSTNNELENNSEGKAGGFAARPSPAKGNSTAKYIGLVLFLLLPFLAGYVGYYYGPEKVVEVEVEVEKVVEVEREVERIVEVKVESDAPVSQDDVETDVVSDYLSSTFRVVSAVDNPYYSEESKYNKLVVVTPRGVNDHTCGGLYVPDTCYFFLESSYANIETPIFVTTWSGMPQLLVVESVEFVSPTIIEFESQFGDGGVRVESVWQIDLETGSSTKVSSKEEVTV